MPKKIDEAEIFSAAVDLFVSEGYRGTTTKQIALAAGVNEATLFRRYGTKAQLMQSAIDHQWQDVPFASLAYSGDVDADLIAIVRAYLETNRLRGAIVPVLLVELSRDEELGGAFRGAAANLGVALDILARHQGSGRLRSEDPMMTLTTLIAPLMVNEMFRRAAVGPPPADIDPPLYVRAFLEGRAADRSVD
jgi:AcrR family transcriptional regulator